MPDKVNIYEVQLKHACRITGAFWATWIEKSDFGWFFGYRYGLTKSRQVSLKKFLCQPKVSSWLAGAISGGRMRTCRTASTADDLGCQQLYAFPNFVEKCAIIVGADHLDDVARAFFRILAMRSPQESYPQLPIDDRLLIRPFEYEGGPSYNLSGVLERILYYLIKNEPADVALIAIRVGDAFRIEASLNASPEKNNNVISIQDDAVLTEIMANREGIILDDITKSAKLRLKLKAAKPVKAWMILPILIGQQVIGLIFYGSHRAGTFTPQDLRRVVSLVNRIAHGVEIAVVFAETARYLQQMALLNELASAASGGVDVDEVANRVRRMLMRTFRTGMVTVLLLSSDGRTLREFSDQNHEAPLVIPIENSLAGVVVETGMPVRVGDTSDIPDNIKHDTGIRSQMAVPLKYRGEVMGFLTVADDRPEKTFSPDDVQLLELLAPQVAVSIHNAQLYKDLQEHIEAQEVAESQLIRSARLAAVGEMAAGVAHELNNPLTIVTGFVELILEELPSDSPQRPDLELVLREARRARGVVRQLLDFSRPVEDVRVTADLNEMVSEVLALVKHLASTSGIQMYLDLWEGLPEVCLDPNQIKQVLLNLIHNALQAMPLGGTLTIQTLTQDREGRKWLGVRVSDTGEGITPEVLERLYEPFFTTRQPGSGTGLGLSVSYGIVTEHGGHIEVDSRPGEGSCFTIWLSGQEEE